MFSTLRTRFGIPGLIATAALVFAMTGGAFAAKYLITSPSQIKPSVLKKLKGATGPAGAAGAQGPAGAKGDAGANGQAGAAGAQGVAGPKGTEGPKGANGKSVKVEEAPEADCEFGGVIVEEESVPASAEPVCSGEPGEKGEKGDPWSVGGTLPPGATLTGAWSFNGTDADTEFMVPLSFPIKLDEALFEENNVLHFTSGKTADCPGSSTQPTAASGHLCVYFNDGGKIVNATFGGIFTPGEPGINEFTEEGTSVGGAVVQFLFDGEAGDLSSGSGTWAVTGAEP